MAVDPQSFFADPDPAIQYTIYSLHMYDYTIYSLHMYDFNVYSVLCTVYTIHYTAILVGDILCTTWDSNTDLWKSWTASLKAFHPLASCLYYLLEYNTIGRQAHC